MSQAINNTALEFNIGDRTTCQFGNSFDTDWSETTHANQPVIVIGKLECEITKKTYYLVKQDGVDFVARASVPYRRNEDPDYCKGELYSTNGRSFGSRAKAWTGVTTLEQAAQSLGFTEHMTDLVATA